VLTPRVGRSRREQEGAQIISGLAFRFLAVIDIEGFSRRSASEQAKLHDSLEYAMSDAAAHAGLDRGCWYRQPRGDGELAVLPAGTNSLSLVADYPRSLASALAELNRGADRDSRLRLRMAIHHGMVYPGLFGPVGEAPITVCRLVDAYVLRQTLRQRIDLDIAFIISAAVYNEIVRGRFSELDAKRFHRARFRTKGNRCVGYLYSTINATRN
jgi:class 3 adenylate cyclase